MSHIDYKESVQISAKDWSFRAIIMAAMRKADTQNMEKLVHAFPHIHEELTLRYNAPGGYLEGERRTGDSRC